MLARSVVKGVAGERLAYSELTCSHVREAPCSIRSDHEGLPYPSISLFHHTCICTGAPDCAGRWTAD
jgi:hypothetical protein